MSRMWRCFRYALPFCWEIHGHERWEIVPCWLKKSRNDLSLYYIALSERKKFDSMGKLSLYHLVKAFINVSKFRIMLEEIYPSIARIIINKYNKITRSILCGSGSGIPNIKMNQIKRCITFIERQMCLFLKLTWNTIKILKVYRP